MDTLFDEWNMTVQLVIKIMQHSFLSMEDGYFGKDSVYKSDRTGIKGNALGKTCFPSRLHKQLQLHL